jgi:nicotinate-nucleotide--dimethylbenzimidazole phosphoribosyltransferase
MPNSFLPINNLTGMPLEDVRAILQQLPAFDKNAFDAAYARQESLFNPPWQLGPLASWPAWLAGTQKRAEPRAQRIELCLFAGTHGWLPVAAQAAKLEALKSQILLLSAGGSAANSAAKNLGAGLKLFDLAIDQPTKDPRLEPAMSARACVQAIAFGMEAVVGQADILCLGSFGAGAFEMAVALACLLWGEPPSLWLDGLDPQAALPFAQAQHMLEAIIAQVNTHKADSLELLRCVGGREMAATLGAMIAARAQNIPVILEGFAALVCAGVLHAYDPSLIDHCQVAAHDGTRAGAAALARLNCQPILGVSLNTQEGLAALLAAQMVKASVALHFECASKTQAQALLRDDPGA